jgi:hypothetical protein
VGVRPRRVEIEIEELVFHGFESIAGRSVADALEIELAAQLRAGSHLKPQSRERIDTRPIEIARRPSAPALGRAIARAVGKELR